VSRWRSLRFEFAAMASPCSLQLDGQDEPAMRAAAAAAIAEVQRIEAKYSRYTADSIVSRINRAAGAEPVEVDAETAELLGFADSLWSQSGGLFDITSGVLRRAWNFKGGTLPSGPAVQALLATVGWQHVERQGQQVRLALPGMELDFGGFGKEYAVDRAAAVLHQHGIQHALVNLGGDLHALGERGLPQMQGTPWSVHIQHPRAEGDLGHNTTLAVLPLARGGLATSGDYERFLLVDGTRYCHILDPRTGWPVSHWQSMTVLAPNTTTAGALATIAMLKGSEAIGWLQAQRVRYLAVQHDGQVLEG
jgi:thiamine biosynthesis lipoprotein